MANAQGAREVPEPYTRADDAKDLKSVLFHWTRNMGMLWGHDERERGNCAVYEDLEDTTSQIRHQQE